jgi:hypothetical protein
LALAFSHELLSSTWRFTQVVSTVTSPITVASVTSDHTSVARRLLIVLEAGTSAAAAVSAAGLLGTEADDIDAIVRRVTGGDVLRSG